MSEIKVGDIGAGFEEFLVRTGGKGRPTQLIRWTDENGAKQEMKKRLWLKTPAGKPYDVVVKTADEAVPV